MANKRILKREINNVCCELFAECVAASQYGSKASEEDAGAVLRSIILTNNDFVKRISHPEPGLDAKTYYKDLTQSFKKQVQELQDQIAGLY